MNDDFQSIVRPDASAPSLTMAGLSAFFRDLEQRQAPPPDRNVVVMSPGTYRALWNTLPPMRRKLARMVKSSMRPRPR